jgi:tetratricopeptide (TPR) repeat protein
MKQQLVLFLFTIFSLALYSQDKVLDSLQIELSATTNDIDRTNIFNAIATQYKYSDPKKMAEYGEKALTLALKIDYKIAQGHAYLNIGTSNIILGEYQEALDHFNASRTIFENPFDAGIDKLIINEGIAQTYGSMGIVFSEQSNYSKALQFYLKSVQLYESLGNSLKCSRLYNNIGVVYKSQSSDFKALEYFIKAQKIQETLKDPNTSITLTNIANIYFKQNDLVKALEYYNAAKIHLDQFPNARALGEWHNNMGGYFAAKDKSDLALQNWQNAAITFQSINDKFGLADTHLYLAEFYLEKNKEDKALAMANKALQLASNIDVLEQQAVSEKLLSDIYIKKGSTALALEHFQKYSQLKDSLTNEDNIRKGVEAAMNYEFEKKELVQLEENYRRELLLKEEAKSAKLKLIFGALTTLLLFGIGFLIYNRNQLKKTLTLEKELAEYEQKALHLQMNPHFVFNCLGSISSFIVQNGTDSAIKYLSKFSKLMRLTLEYSKESLIPIDKEIESLQNYLELEQLRFNHKFNFTIHKSHEIEDDVALPPLLIQPFIENAIIHGVVPKKEAGAINIDFRIENNALLCTISDDGIGINQSKKNKENSVLAHKSMALEIIKKRLEMISEASSKSATISIDELNNREEITGTKVSLSLPLQYIDES